MPVNSTTPNAASEQDFTAPGFGPGPQGFRPQGGFVNAAAAFAPPVQNDVVLALQNRIRQTETAQRVGQGKVISSGCEPIDRLLPGRGYSPGTLVQWLVPDVLPGADFKSAALSGANSRGTTWNSADRVAGVAANEVQPGGHAADYLSLLSAIEACKDGKSLVVLDPWHQFYPPAVAALGVDMANLIILRAQGMAQTNGGQGNGAQCNGVQMNGGQSTAKLSDNDLYWAIDQSLRCSAVGAVWGPVGAIDERWFRRFQLSAESSGCLGLFIQSAKEAKAPSWAEVQWLVDGAKTSRSPVACPNDVPVKNDRLQRVKLRLVRCRAGKAGRSIEVGVDAVTGQVKSCGEGQS